MEPERPREPDILRKPAGDGQRRPPGWDGPEVGEFRQGSALSQWALGRYLVGRALAESVGTSLLLVAVACVGLAVLCEWLLHSVGLAALVLVVAIGVLVLRFLLLAVVRRVTGLGQFAPVEGRLRALVADTRGDVLRELRRVGLPGHTLTLPLLAVRLLSRRRRPDTVARLRSFETDRAVPAGRLDELHLLLRSGPGGGGPPGGTPR